MLCDHNIVYRIGSKPNVEASMTNKKELGNVYHVIPFSVCSNAVIHMYKVHCIVFGELSKPNSTLKLLGGLQLVYYHGPPKSATTTFHDGTNRAWIFTDRFIKQFALIPWFLESLIIFLA